MLLTMEVHQLRYFCAVVMTGSFTKAAAEEGIAQPSLSQQIQKLEQELGTKVFERLGRRIKLTPAGEALLPEATAVLAHLQAAQQAVVSIQEGVRGPLRAGAIPTILPYFLAPRLRDFTDRYPEVDLQLREDITQRLLERLQGGELDVALLALPVANPDLVARELFREQLMLAVSARHPWAAQPAANLAAVDGERLLLLKEGHCFRDDVLTVCTRARARFQSVFESDQLASLFPLVASGFGVSIVPEMAAARAEGCRLIPFARPAVRRVGYVRRRTAGNMKVVSAFTEWLRKEAGKPHSN